MSVTPPTYFDTYSRQKGKSDFRFKVFVESLEMDPHYNEKLLLYEDILSGNRNNLYYIFPNTGKDDIEVIALSELTNLPNAFLQNDQGLFEFIFQRALGGKYLAKSELVFRNLYALYAQKNGVLSYPFILELLKIENFNSEFKIMYARALSENDDSVRFQWDKLSTAKHNELVPAFVFFFHRNQPIHASKALKDVSENFASKYNKYFYHPIEETLLRIAREGDDRQLKQMLKQFNKISSDIPSNTLRKIINEIIAYNGNLTKLFNTENENTEREINPSVYAGGLQAVNWLQRVLNISK